MRNSIIFIFLLFFPFVIHAAEVTCFSGKTRIYHGWGDDFVYTADFMAFTEYKTHHLIMVSAECVIMAPIEQGERIHAA